MRDLVEAVKNVHKLYRDKEVKKPKKADSDETPIEAPKLDDKKEGTNAYGK